MKAKFNFSSYLYKLCFFLTTDTLKNYLFFYRNIFDNLALIVLIRKHIKVFIAFLIVNIFFLSSSYSFSRIINTQSNNVFITMGSTQPSLVNKYTLIWSDGNGYTNGKVFGPEGGTLEDALIAYQGVKPDSIFIRIIVDFIPDAHFASISKKYKVKVADAGVIFFYKVYLRPLKILLSFPFSPFKGDYLTVKMDNTIEGQVISTSKIFNDSFLRISSTKEIDITLIYDVTDASGAVTGTEVIKKNSVKVVGRLRGNLIIPFEEVIDESEPVIDLKVEWRKRDKTVALVKSSFF